MPTENRSSNTEMAADQLPPCADDVFKNGVSACLVGDVPKHAAETICQSLSAITGWKIDWHYIGGRTHIKALAPVAQPNPEPIAWMVGTAIWWTKEEAERDAAATGLSIVGLGPMTGAAPAEQHQGIPVGEVVAFGKGLHEIAWAAGRMPKLGAKLYTHADPVEVEQLREVIKHSDAQIMRQSMRISNQRAQLAERDALLRDINKRHSSGVDFDLPADLAARVAAVCATSAEPSAPVEIDERAEFEEFALEELGPYHNKAEECLIRSGETYVYGLVHTSWRAWQARAALERKP
ncbi:hypothetical protein [Pseudomonas qingdaonensis]|uniref:hypothetical protein n=1 Tax=Pseudomonas qingdaonensis TaxID=2056231 RepID=UPI001F40A13E|nr:hypothetical protein [Pseudomonas qingdaonensis]